MSPMQPVLKIFQTNMERTAYAQDATVFGATSYLPQAWNLSQRLMTAFESFERVHDITVRLQEYEYGNIQSSLQAKMTDNLAHFLNVISKIEAGVKRKRFEQWARSVFLQDDGINSC